MLRHDVPLSRESRRAASLARSARRSTRPPSRRVCRLFGMHGGERRVRATFWLLDAPGSLVVQSRGQPDGFGIGTFDDGRPDIDKGPIAAHQDALFAREAREECSRTYVAHLRFASTGPVTLGNSHPFEQHGRLFAHNGVVWGLPELEARLGDHRSLVHGDTDSERFFALVTVEIERHDGDVEGGIRAAVAWVADRLPLYSLNFVLTTATDMWALRYPDTNELWVLERMGRGGELEAAGTAGTMRVRSGELGDTRAVIVATEPMDADPGWRALAPGELLHVPKTLACASSSLLDHPPAHQLSLADLDERGAASQTADRAAPATGV